MALERRERCRRIAPPKRSAGRRVELGKIEQRVKSGRITKARLEKVTAKALKRENLSRFVVVTIGGDEERPTLEWRVDAILRRRLETTRLGRRVICTDRHAWGTARIVNGFRGQWNVEELFRRAKKGGIAPWGPSYLWADSSLRLHTFATVIGLMLVSLVRLALGTSLSPKKMMAGLADIRATLVRTTTGKSGRRPTVMLPPALVEGFWWMTTRVRASLPLT